MSQIQFVILEDCFAVLAHEDIPKEEIYRGRRTITAAGSIKIEAGKILEESLSLEPFSKNPPQRALEVLTETLAHEMKYVRTLRGFVLGHLATQHKELGPKDGAVSAGHTQLIPEIRTWGESISLKIRNEEKDSQKLKDWLS